MSVALSFDIRDNATQAMDALMRKSSPGQLAQVVSEPLRIYWRDRLKSLGTNKRGWPSTGFWESAARSMTAAVSGPTLTLSVNKVGVRQRAFGGMIRPVKAAALAIPISPVSYGHRPSEFPGLFMIKTARGAYLVQAAETIVSSGRGFKREKGLGGNTKRRLRAGLNFLFKLSSGVNQLPDERVIPTRDELAEVAMGAMTKELSA